MSPHRDNERIHETRPREPHHHLTSRGPSRGHRGILRPVARRDGAGSPRARATDANSCARHLACGRSPVRDILSGIGRRDPPNRPHHPGHISGLRRRTPLPIPRLPTKRPAWVRTRCRFTGPWAISGVGRQCVRVAAPERERSPPRQLPRAGRAQPLRALQSCRWPLTVASAR